MEKVAILECLFNILQGKHLYELSVLFSVANWISFPSLLSNTFWNVNLAFCSFLPNTICKKKNEMAEFIIVNDHTIFGQLFFLETKIIATKFHMHEQWKQKFRAVWFKWRLGSRRPPKFILSAWYNFLNYYGVSLRILEFPDLIQELC